MSLRKFGKARCRCRRSTTCGFRSRSKLKLVESSNNLSRTKIMSVAPPTHALDLARFDGSRQPPFERGSRFSAGVLQITDRENFTFGKHGLLKYPRQLFGFHTD